MKTQSVLLASLVAGVLAVTAGTRSDATAIDSLTQATEWLNSPPLQAEDLRGKVVLVDFWTYTCVNWMRTLPYLREWSEKYRDQGLVVIGVHSPEFGFERNAQHVRRATQALGVDYPVAIDSDHAIWRAYHNQYWPAVYLIDASGRVRFRHVGEADYGQLEQALRSLLPQAAAGSDDKPAPTSAKGAEVAADWKNLRSGENYLGRERTVNFASPEGLGRGTPRTYSIPQRLRLNEWSLDGAWTITPEASVLDRAPGRIAYRFHARDVNLVMGVATLDHPVKFRVRIDGMPPGEARGTDVDAEGYGSVDEPRLYQLIRQPSPIVERTFEIEFFGEDVAAFSFTFG
ncbi:MAG TPA: thioredoxin family protein [Povalibacter sp.]|uniref:thioredoxin family protein n=1 Tax=Povalibacter sp. TaxID=1962978 RepID=UPI002CFA1FAC|nr:thioredoxin family protein [Povalibacter sp.]HMN47126.1 thioredoxin family protein [Povalibacter sp.]